MADPDDQDEEATDERAPDWAGSDDAGTAGWTAWVRRNFSAASRLQSGSASRRSAGRAEFGEESSAEASSRATKAAVNGLDRREHRMGVVATIAELGLTALVAIPYLLHNHQRSTSELKTLGAVHIFLIEGLLLGAVLLVGTLVKRRALLGFASLLVGIWLLQIKALSLLGIAYLGFGLWLVIKALKYTNKEGRAGGSAAGAGAGRAAGRGSHTRSWRQNPAREGRSYQRRLPRRPLGAQAQQALHAAEGEQPVRAEETGPRAR